MLAQEPRRLAVGLSGWGLEPGETVEIMLPTGRSLFLAFMGALMAGGTPGSIYPPARPDQIEHSLRRSAKIIENCQAAIWYCQGNVSRPPRPDQREERRAQNAFL